MPVEWGKAAPQFQTYKPGLNSRFKLHFLWICSVLTPKRPKFEPCFTSLLHLQDVKVTNQPCVWITTLTPECSFMLLFWIHTIELCVPVYK